MKVLVIDVGGTNVKILASGHKQPLKFPSGSKLTPARMVAGVKKLAAGWEYDVISIGVPSPVLLGQLICNPRNLGPGWVGFDFGAAFGVPVKVVNDAAMQALGSYKGGKMLFFGLGTGLGAALVMNGVAESREIAHLPYKDKTYETYVGVHALRRLGKKVWRKHVEKIVSELAAAIQPDDIVLGGGNVKKLKKLPKGSRAGSNANAFLGGYRLWQGTPGATSITSRVFQMLPRKQESRDEMTPPALRQTKRRS
jgi:polyphosphate glucokinase